MMVSKEWSDPFKNLNRAPTIRVSGMSLPIRKMEEEFKSGPMALATTASGRTVWQMVSVDLYTPKETSTKVSGPMTRQMAMESTPTIMALVMKATGTRISNTAGVSKSGQMKLSTKEIMTPA